MFFWVAHGMASHMLFVKMTQNALLNFMERQQKRPQRSRQRILYGLMALAMFLFVSFWFSMLLVDLEPGTKELAVKPNVSRTTEAKLFFLETREIFRRAPNATSI
ncbi:MAG: hypothetical protein COV10_01355 [Candidatus Vogelbacteria bacterium CG10_big_fil_rev_8_21_14_0_10_51_16]|uniref:Uncharacterized protein n=1 Tax=Candidatus Vogelbacteria bacterium CG10_big_fil_rev_8_21_14_0_10_51_16 TaxID=1975045 RepID=A0A2H0REV7_9BACT|nr:MAG: hypothetical protein COV10_01355 [Candidatus Vogelbacteria bacterium CG10_big_fil_rev_8_21_14_0_10_51_16]